MYLTFDDQFLEEKIKQNEKECDELVKKANNLSWWKKAFTAEYDNLRKELFLKHRNFYNWQSNYLKEKMQQNMREINNIN